MLKPDESFISSRDFFFKLINLDFSLPILDYTACFATQKKYFSNTFSQTSFPMIHMQNKLNINAFFYLFLHFFAFRFLFLFSRDENLLNSTFPVMFFFSYHRFYSYSALYFCILQPFFELQGPGTTDTKIYSMKQHVLRRYAQGKEQLR